MDVFRQIFDWLGSALNSILGWVLFVLPDSPFKLLSNSPISEYINYINYFVPVGTCIKIGEAWLAAIVIFYLWSVVARWIKLIE